MICNKISCFFCRASFKRIIHSYINLLLSTCIVIILSLLSIIIRSQSIYVVCRVSSYMSNVPWVALYDIHSKMEGSPYSAIKLYVVINFCAQFNSVQNTHTRFLCLTPLESASSSFVTGIHHVPAIIGSYADKETERG